MSPTGAGGRDERIERRLGDLGDLARFAGDAAYTVGLGIEAYLEDSPQGRVLRNNGRHIVIQIATVAEKLPESFKAAHPSTDWVAIGRMRHLLARRDDRVDDRLVLQALAGRIPALVEDLGLEP